MSFITRLCEEWSKQYVKEGVCTLCHATSLVCSFDLLEDEDMHICRNCLLEAMESSCSHKYQLNTLESKWPKLVFFCYKCQSQRIIDQNPNGKQFFTEQDINQFKTVTHDANAH